MNLVIVSLIWNEYNNSFSYCCFFFNFSTKHCGAWRQQVAEPTGESDGGGVRRRNAIVVILEAEPRRRYLHVLFEHRLGYDRRECKAFKRNHLELSELLGCSRQTRLRKKLSQSSEYYLLLLNKLNYIGP